MTASTPQPPIDTQVLEKLLAERANLERRYSEMAAARQSLANIVVQLDGNARQIANHVAEAGLLAHLAAVTTERDEARSAADELAASVLLLAHDAHPVYGNTAGWRGGIGGQAMTPSCSLIDPPPDALWTQCDMPTEVARNWVRQRDTDWQATKGRLRHRWTAALTSAPTASDRDNT